MKVMYSGNTEFGEGIWTSLDGDPIYKSTRNFRAALDNRHVIVINDPFKSPTIIYADNLEEYPFVDGMILEIDIPARPHIDMDSYQYGQVILPKLMLRTLLWHALNNGCKDLDIDYCLSLLSGEDVGGACKQEVSAARANIDLLRNTGNWISGTRLDGEFTIQDLLDIAFVEINGG
ncbi:hypothetical protein PP187_gp308 [Klebsiella phage vB_KvM-Eowyn]|uniref:Uncharacterized protein n=1 Tax=Klebsiella phage vB_KvM-Eowyn TaxID=2762819 RepID=A0A7R8MJW1_9CAUD|nr:hypothetical protein PP187_gp308 [Klebsiella phage vB_KvM-Eowyn]CAD5236297.1 hypothetical protein LLCLJKAH_00308 [Klebsiella phage vB_KvM-Eowyn]